MASVEKPLNQQSDISDLSRDKPRQLSAAHKRAIAPFLVMDVMAQANQREQAGADIIHMEVGQPGVAAPKAVREAAADELKNGLIGYTDALGLPALRERIAHHYQTHYQCAVAPEQVVVTTGSSAAFILAFLSIFDPGDRVLLTQPGYPCYRNILAALDIDAVEVPLSSAQGWALTREMVEDAHAGSSSSSSALAGAGRSGVQGALLASPANPTGTMMSAQRLKEICQTCAENNIWFISDEIYHGLTYGAAGETALKFNPSAIVINSFSKYFSMTGWRIGWMIVPQELVRPVERLAQNLYISAPTLSQKGALAAFDAIEECEANRAVYAANRELLLNELPKLGITDFAPADGAFYLYADVSRFTQDSAEFASRMLREIGVAATPGYDFDPVRGGQYIRFSYARTQAEISQAVERLRNWSF